MRIACSLVALLFLTPIVPARYWEFDPWPGTGKKRVLVSAELHALTKLIAKDDLDVRCFLPSEDKHNKILAERADLVLAGNLGVMSTDPEPLIRAVFERLGQVDPPRKLFYQDRGLRHLIDLLRQKADRQRAEIEQLLEQRKLRRGW